MLKWFTFKATVDGSTVARDESEARMIIESELGILGAVDIEVLDCEDCEEEEED